MTILKRYSLVLVLVVTVLATASLYYKSISKWVIKDTEDCAENLVTDNQVGAKEINNNLSRYTQSSQVIFGLSTEGGIQTNYVDDSGDVKFIRQIFYGETFRSELEYYLLNNHVFYISVKRFEYERPIFEDPSANIQNVITREFYLDKEEKLCAWYLDDIIQKNDSNTEEFVSSVISTTITPENVAD